MGTRHISFRINGKPRTEVVDTRLLLVDFVCDTLLLTGAQSCGGDGCTGGCTLLVDDWPVCGCMTLAAAMDGASIRSVEGLRCDDGTLHPLQHAFIEHCPSLCSHCTAGTLVSATALLETNPRPTPEDVRRALSGNLCDCTGYLGVVDAVMAAAMQMHAAREVRQ